jgi:hypothetical protein
MTGPVDRCEVTELPKDGCAHCRPAPVRGQMALTVEQLVLAGPPFQARFPGVCVGCRGAFEADDTIGRVTEADGGGYVCTECLP